MAARPFHLGWFLEGSSTQARGEPWTGHIGQSWMVPGLFLSGAGAVTLPWRMWDDLRFQTDLTIAAASTLTIVPTTTLLAGMHVVRRRGGRLQGTRPM